MKRKTSLATRRKKRKQYQKVAKTTPLGEGGRFRALAESAKASGARNPEAVAAMAGRRKYGKARMSRWAAAGRRRKS